VVDPIEDALLVHAWPRLAAAIAGNFCPTAFSNATNWSEPHIAGAPRSFSDTHCSAFRNEIRAIESRFCRFAPETQELLRSIPGIGANTAASLVAHIGDIHRFSSPEKLVAYIGLDCRVYQSGTSVNGRGFISKRGNRHLRSILFNAAFVARQRNPELKAYFEKKVNEGQHYYSALTAVERKLVHLIYPIWKRGTPFMAQKTLVRV
jgi:hypothetical protein